MIYDKIIETKNEQKTPVFISGKTFHSKYNPEREAVQLVQNTKESSFFAVTGLGAGFYVQELRKVFPSSFILVIEKSEEDISFLLNNIPELKNLFDEKTKICSISKLSETLPQYYLPALYPTFSVFSVQSWLSEIDMQNLFDTINLTLKNISADFATQAHFGKIWQKNIISNLKIQKKAECHFPTEKQCIIAAAGPGLDFIEEKIKNKRDEYYIIATDTAYRSLSLRKIISDAVISIDGQEISHSHFMGRTASETTFFFELTACPSAARKIQTHSGSTIFLTSQHPLSQYADSHSPESFIQIDSSSGTVTIAALDLAVKAGFKDIFVYGADFGYVNNKPYAKGTYLDRSFYNKGTKLSTAETSFSRLMYRSSLIKVSENKKTTELLQFYENQLFQWAAKNNCSIKKENDCFRISSSGDKKLPENLKSFDFTTFINRIKNEPDERIRNMLTLPYAAWLQKHNNYPGQNITDDYSKLALNFILRYNF